MKRIAIIPARGGSKRIPKKNCKLFFDKPIIVYSIEAALKSGLYDEVMVSTDDIEIKEIALKHGAKVPFLRSEVNSNDFATTVDVILEVLDFYSKNDQFFKTATCIYACAPFVTPQLLKKSLEILDQEECDCVYPIQSYTYPIQRAVKINENGKISFFNELNINSRTQDFERTFHDVGMFYTFDIYKLYQTKSLLTNNTFSIVLENNLAQDIDTEDDWKIAEMKYKLFSK